MTGSAASAKKTGGRSRFVWLVLVVALAVGVLGPRLPWPADLAPAGGAALAVTAAVVMLWASGAVPSAVAALLAIVLLTTSGAATLADALRGFASPTVFFLLGVLGLGLATVESGLAQRLAQLVLARAAGRPGQLFRDMVISFAALAFFLPSASTRGGVLLPVYEEVLRLLDVPRHGALAKALMQGLSALNRLGSTALLTGGVTPIVAAALIGGMSWGRWFVLVAPPMYVILALGGLLVYALYRPRAPAIGSPVPARTPWSASERRALLIVLAVVALWLTEDLHHLHAAVPALVGLIVACAPGVGVLRWSTVERSLGWSNILVLGAALSLASAVTTSGAAAWLAGPAKGFLGSVAASAWTATLGLLAVSFALRIVLPNIASYLTLMIPLTMALASELGLNPLVAALLVTIAGDAVLYYPAQSPSSLLVAERGHIESGEVLRLGFLMTALASLVLLLVAVPYWAWLGEPLVRGR
ncbi:MAG: SLC13 family permease [Chloroflexi bacterium]|nr:SLC13 family permease [Chloroflexota bacterium]